VTSPGNARRRWSTWPAAANAEATASPPVNHRSTDEYGGQGYDTVLARVVPQIPGALAPGAPVPTGSALSQARARLAASGEPMRELFEQTARTTEPATAGCSAFGLVLTAFDGTVSDLAATDAIEAEFAVPTGGRYPQARLVTLVSCGTRRVRAAALGSYATSEQTLVDSLAGALTPDTLNLSDRNFFSMHRWVRFSATGAELAWRVKNGAKSLPAKIVDVLPEGSTLVRLRESASMLARRRREAGDPDLDRLPDTLARLIEFDVLVTDGRGRTRTSRFRVLTTLLDHIAYPAHLIAAVYAQRWQVEIAERLHPNARMLSHLRDRRIVAVIESGEDPAAGLFLATQLAGGQPLREILERERRLTPERTMAIIAGAAEALGAAHDFGVLHCDLHPGCLFVGAQDWVELAGLANCYLGRGASPYWVSHPPYLDPEAAMGERRCPESISMR
jgi:hypothetical protein